MFRSQKTLYYWMEGNGRRLYRASRCMWINPLVVWTPAFIGEVTFNPQNSLITFLWESSQTKKGTGFDARSFFERLYQCQKLYNSLMDNKKYDSLLFKLKASPILQNLLIPFLGERLFRCVLQLHAGHDLRYGDFSGPPQRWPYLLFKGFIFTTA